MSDKCSIIEVIKIIEPLLVIAKLETDETDNGVV